MLVQVDVTHEQELHQPMLDSEEAPGSPAAASVQLHPMDVSPVQQQPQHVLHDADPISLADEYGSTLLYELPMAAPPPAGRCHEPEAEGAAQTASSGSVPPPDIHAEPCSAQAQSPVSTSAAIALQQLQDSPAEGSPQQPAAALPCSPTLQPMATPASVAQPAAAATTAEGGSAEDEPGHRLPCPEPDRGWHGQWPQAEAGTQPSDSPAATPAAQPSLADEPALVEYEPCAFEPAAAAGCAAPSALDFSHPGRSRFCLLIRPPYRKYAGVAFLDNA